MNQMLLVGRIKALRGKILVLVVEHPRQEEFTLVLSETLAQYLNAALAKGIIKLGGAMLAKGNVQTSTKGKVFLNCELVNFLSSRD